MHLEYFSRSRIFPSKLVIQHLSFSASVQICKLSQKYIIIPNSSVVPLNFPRIIPVSPHLGSGSPMVKMS